MNESSFLFPLKPRKEFSLLSEIKFYTSRANQTKKTRAKTLRAKIFRSYNVQKLICSGLKRYELKSKFLSDSLSVK